ncbi:MAG: glycosyltransferase [Planctomycetota bacterium]|nr:glycosyltransferase [Planctomycetota bacterium]
MPTFSIITPNFNSDEKLKVTAASVLDQGADVEYLIADGASTDRSIDIAGQLARDHPDRVRLISEPDSGVYDAINKAIHVSKGRFIYVIGAGDFMMPEVLKRCAECLPDRKLAILYGNVIWKGQTYDGPWTREKFGSKNICHQAMLVERGVFKNFGMYDSQYPILADYAFNISLFANREIEWQYLPITFATYEGAGVSDRTPDTRFLADKESLIRDQLGFNAWVRCYHGSLTRYFKSLVISKARRVVRRRMPNLLSHG